MIISAEQIFSDDQNLTSSGASTNLIDLGSTGTVLGAPAALVRDIGKGTPICVVVQLTVDATGTNPTLTAALQMDTTAAFSSATTVATSEALAGGSAGDKLELYFMPEGVTEQFIRLNYTLGGSTPDYTVSAFVTFAAQTADGVAGV